MTHSHNDAFGGNYAFGGTPDCGAAIGGTVRHHREHGAELATSAEARARAALYSQCMKRQIREYV